MTFTENLSVLTNDTLFSGTALKNDKFHLQEHFWLYEEQSQPTFTIPVKMLAHFYEMPIQVDKSAKGGRLFF